MISAQAAIRVESSIAAVNVTAPFVDWLIVLPLIIALSGAALCVLLRKHSFLRNAALIIALTLITADSLYLLLLTIITGPVSMTMGDWPPPFGISLTADITAALFEMFAVLTTLLVTLHDLRRQSALLMQHALAPALILVLIAGVSGAFLTSDIFNLYVWLEVTLIAAFGLLVLGGKPVQLEGTLKYAFLNLFATTLFLIATAFLYSATGTLNMADLHLTIPQIEHRAILIPIGMLYLVALAMKAAIFPLFFWLPAAYHTPYPTVSALFAALITKIGLYILFRLTSLIFVDVEMIDVDFAGIIALTTLLAGAAGMLTDHIPRRLLGWTVIAGSGASILALAFTLSPQPNPHAYQAFIFYMVQSILALAVLFLLTERVLTLRRQQPQDDPQATLWATHPLISALFVFAIAAIAGIPPTSGFWAKILIIKAGLAAQAYWLLAGFILATLLTLIAMGRFAVELLMTHPGMTAPIIADHDNSRQPPANPTSTLSLTPGLLLLLLLLLFIGFFPNLLMAIAEFATEQIIDPSAYIDATLGVRP